jgi:hypothetical protein
LKRIVSLLGACVALLALCEVGATWATARLKSRQTVRDDVRAASAVGGPRSVLIVGNSLVLHGIDAPAVEQALGTGYAATKLSIVDSGYLDWLYGIMSLFDRGSQPEALVLAISPTQLVEDRPPTGTTARMLWTTPNLVRYALERRPGLTAVSDRIFEHFSEFFAIRSRLRQDARRLIVPGYETMSRRYFAPTLDPSSDTTHDERIAAARLSALDSICAKRRVRFVFLLIPTHTVGDRGLEQTLVAAGERAGVPVLVPVSNGALDTQWLLDGYHLNATGAYAFSTRAGVALAAELAHYH